MLVSCTLYTVSLCTATVQHQLLITFVLLFQYFFLISWQIKQQWGSVSVTLTPICNINPIHLWELFIEQWTERALDIHFIIIEDQNKWQQIIMNCSRCNVKCLRRHNTMSIQTTQHHVEPCFLKLPFYHFVFQLIIHFLILYNNEQIVMWNENENENENMRN